jgi:penicillin V acylase-like amidase (Ntn superfamily)
LADPSGLVPSWWPSFFGGFEGNLFIYGRGISWVSCCDDNNVRWEFAYEKVCWGPGLGGSLSGGLVSGMSSKKCDYRRYEGYFIEFKSIPFLTFDIGSDGVNDYGLNAGLQYGYLMVCKYKKFDQRKLGCCN